MKHMQKEKQKSLAKVLVLVSVSLSGKFKKKGRLKFEKCTLKRLISLFRRKMHL